MDFAYYFHYCKNLKFEDRPDYATLKSLFYDLIMQEENSNMNYPEFTFDWYNDENNKEDKENEKFGAFLKNDNTVKYFFTLIGKKL